MKTNVISFIKQERIWEILFLGFLFCFFMGWAYIMPFDSCPDERMRYQVAEYIYQNGTIPRGDDPAIRNELWGISYAFNPILAYMIGAVFMKIMSIFTTDFSWMVLAARMVSVVCGVGTAYFTLKIAKKLFRQRAGMLFTALVTLLPQCVFMFTYVNSDSLALFSVSVIVYMWICGIESKWDVKYCIGLAVGISVCALSYYNAYGFILCSIGLFGISILFCYEKRWDYQTVIKKGLLVSAIVLLLAGWWFIRNYMIYDGDFLGQKTSAIYSELYAVDGLKPSQRETPQSNGWSVWDMLFYKSNWLWITASSFVGCFGYMNLPVPKIIVCSYLLLCGIGLAGNLLTLKADFFVLKDKEKRSHTVFHWCMFIAMLIPNILNVYYSYTSDYQPQGRYSLPMIIPFAYFVVRGLENIVLKITKNKLVWDVLCVVISMLFLISAVYVYETIIRATYLPEPLIHINI